jgi:hypothetical protein
MMPVKHMISMKYNHNSFPEDITPPPGVQQAMEMQAEAERRKRAQILESEGQNRCLYF